MRFSFIQIKYFYGDRTRRSSGPFLEAVSAQNRCTIPLIRDESNRPRFRWVFSDHTAYGVGRVQQGQNFFSPSSSSARSLPNSSSSITRATGPGAFRVVAPTHAASPASALP